MTDKDKIEVVVREFDLDYFFKCCLKDFWWPFVNGFTTTEYSYDPNYVVDILALFLAKEIEDKWNIKCDCTRHSDLSKEAIKIFNMRVKSAMEKKEYIFK
jgi:hypothetical protein